MLYRISNIIPELTIRHRFRVVFGLFGAMLAHIVEVWLFALGYFFMINMEWIM